MTRRRTRGRALRKRYGRSSLEMPRRLQAAWRGGRQAQVGRYSDGSWYVITLSGTPYHAVENSSGVHFIMGHKPGQD